MQTFLLRSDQIRAHASQQVLETPFDPVHEVVIRPYKVSRTLEQNCAQWPYLTGFAQQLQWPVNGKMCWMSEEEWKDVLTAAFEKETDLRLAAGFDGGVVMLGKRTSKFSVKKFSEWMEFLIAAAALKGVTPVYKNEPRWAEQYQVRP